MIAWQWFLFRFICYEYSCMDHTVLLSWMFITHWYPICFHSAQYHNPNFFSPFFPFTSADVASLLRYGSTILKKRSIFFYLHLLPLSCTHLFGPFAGTDGEVQGEGHRILRVCGVYLWGFHADRAPFPHRLVAQYRAKAKHTMPFV